MSHRYAGKNRRTRKGIMIVKYLRKMLVYHKTERDSAWFGAGGGGQCTLWVKLVPCLQCQKSLGQLHAAAPFCFEIPACTAVPVGAITSLCPLGRCPCPRPVGWVCWKAVHTPNGSTGHRDTHWSPWPRVFLKKDISARPTGRVPKICTNSTTTLFSTSYTCVMHIT